VIDEELMGLDGGVAGGELEEVVALAALLAE
jgi:hypothetical protein